MLALGLLLLAATGAFTGLLIAENPDGPTTTVTMFGNDLATMNSLAVFLAGIALTLVLVFGCLLVLAGSRRHRRRSAELRTSRRDRAEAAPAEPAGTPPYASAPQPQPYADRAPLGGASGGPAGPGTQATTAGPRPEDAAAEPAPQTEPQPKRRPDLIHRLGH
ncbi:hypothetical protein [Kitasatospora sp. DSM 101779]|uniref:hypothetical protein n=1 Tax=Kitasatospora sp. DSM 101779 TaxID=2853165 RepID=UPI0021D8757D|nr:hypothetical protein [Kitasatospora sp. DSM 101779]MCU7821263.1 hypothetical protein [Kitasatospora sp. DSM 101779]